jgi:hypothetical protein
MVLLIKFFIKLLIDLRKEKFSFLIVFPLNSNCEKQTGGQRRNEEERGAIIFRFLFCAGHPLCVSFPVVLRKLTR